MLQSIVVMKVLTFIVSVIRVKLHKITLHLLFFVSDDLWMFCVSVVLFLFFENSNCLIQSERSIG